MRGTRKHMTINIKLTGMAVNLEVYITDLFFYKEIIEHGWDAKNQLQGLLCCKE